MIVEYIILSTAVHSQKIGSAVASKMCCHVASMGTQSLIDAVGSGTLMCAY
jgi:hypothetical protein